MRSFFRGDVWAVCEQLGSGDQVTADFCDVLLEKGLLHALDKFEGFAHTEEGIRKLRVHCVLHHPEHGRSGIEVGIRKWGVGEYPSPTSRAERSDPSQAPYYPDDWCKADGPIEDRLDISMHKSER